MKEHDAFSWRFLDSHLSKGSLMTSYSIRKFPFIVLFACLFQAQSLLANILERITATGATGGDAVWSIVSESERNETDLAPGIYTRGKNQTWDHNIVKGRVLGREHASGLMQLELTRWTNRLEAWAIVDHKFHIFHINSDPNDQGTSITIGNEKAQLIDPTHPYVQAVNIPPIHSLDDVVVSTGQPNSSPAGQEVLVSLRNPYSPFLGQTGLTFVFRISGESTGEYDLNLDGNILVLDYLFHDQSQLDEIAQKKGYISFNFLKKISFIQETDSIFLKVWKKELKEYIKSEKYYNVPYLDKKTEKFVYPQTPTLTISKRSRLSRVSIISEYDMEGNPPKLIISSQNKQKELFGEINFYPEVEENLAEIDIDELADFAIFRQDSSHSLFYFNRELFLLNERKHSNEIDLIKLDHMPFQGELPENFDFRVKHTTNSLFLFLSAIVGKKSETIVYKFKRTGSILSYLTDVKICHGFFEYYELGARIHEKDDKLFFDHQTITNEETPYATAYDKTRAHIDVEKSLQNQKANIGFIKPLKSTKIANGVSFQTFNNEDKRKKLDGLYFKNIYHPEENFILGQILPRNQDGADLDETDKHFSTNDEEVILAKTIVNHSSGLIELAVVAVDPSYKNGENSFSLAFISKHEDETSKPIVSFHEINLSFNDFKGILLHGGKTSYKKNDLFLGAIAAFKNEEQSSNSQKLINYDLIFSRHIQEDRLDPKYNLELKYSICNLTQFADLNLLEEIKGGLLSDILTYKKNGSLNNYYYGQILKPKVARTNLFSIGTPDSKALDEKIIDHSSLGRIHVAIYAIDTDFNHGEDSFTIVIAVKSTNGTEYFVKKIPYPFQSLGGINIQNRAEYGQQENIFGVIYALDSNERSKRSRVPSGFHSVMFNIKKDQGTVSKPHDTLLASPYSQVLQEVEHPAITDIEYRLLMDRYGNLYWPTSDYPRSHRFFQVTTLSNGKKFYPNQVHMELQSVKDLQEVMNYAAKEGCWKVKKGNYRKANLPGLFGRMQKEDLADYKNIIFDDLSESLEEIANPAGNKNHSVLIVSKEVKKYVVNSISAKWLLEDESSRNWSYKNNQLSLYYLNRDNPLNQEIIAENFHGMEEAAQRQRNVVLYVDLEDIVNFSHPNEGNVDKPYNISVPFESDQDQTSSMTEINGSLSVEEKQEPASLLYILASEGRVIPLKEFMQSGPPEISIMLVGTKQEWDKVKEKTSSFERSYGLLDHFNEISLQTPSITQRRELLLKILDDKANLFNGIEYEGDKIFLKDPSYSTEEIREKVLDYAVSRSQALAQEKGENVFVSFVKLLNQFKLNVKPGSAHEKRGTLHINKAFIESLMCDLYALPLNLRSLPDSDPLRILSHKNSPMKLNEAGYAGNFDIKMRIINGILGQTNSGDQKTIPASFVIFGKRGSGKTFLFSTLVKMLGLKYYEFHADEETNRDAQVFKVNLGNVTSSFSSPGKIGRAHV